MNVGRVLVVVALAMIGLFAAAAPAFAHAELQSSSPAQGASLATAPTQVRLTFGEAVTLAPNPITVTGPDGVMWSVGTATVNGAVVSAPVTPSGPAGAYVLTYRVVSDDGDTVSGTVGFTLTAAASPPASAAPSPSSAASAIAAPAAPAQAPAESSHGGVPVWGWVLIALVVVAVVLAVVVRSRRRA